MSRLKTPLRRWVEILTLCGALALAPSLAAAKMGGLLGGGAGSRGVKTYSAPPATNTAPSTAAPIQRSVTPPPATQQQPGFAASQGSFGRSMLGGLAGGLIGAGLFGLLTGHGLFGGLDGFASMIGFLIQFALLAFLARLALQWWQNRNLATAGGARPNAFAFSGAPGAGFRPGFGGGPATRRPQAAPLQLAAADFPAFERLLAQTQDAYSQEDTAALGRLTTAEMAGYFSEELAERRRQGVVNRISGVKLLQGDLAEAWREGSDEYATVAMRFALIDVTLDRASGRIVSGDPRQPTQSTEVWTFRRPAGAGPDAWRLSALQQTA